MPINPNALAGPDPESSTEAVAPDGTELGQSGGASEQEQPKQRTRRSKAQMIADAVIPANDENVDLKDSATGAKIQRPWLVALEMVRDNKAEFADKAMKYSMLKWDQQKAAPAFEEPTFTAATSESPTNLYVVPPEAEVGDEVSIGSETLRVGHGRVLISGDRPVSVDGELVKPARRWIRELGAGPNGPWESVDSIGGSPNGHSEHPVSDALKKTPEPVALPEDAEIEQVGQLTWKVGTGILERIGLPQVEQYAAGSSLQIGPITASRMAVDDGRRTEVTIGKRTATIPTAVIEAFREVCDVTEYVARYQRGELVSFLESTGALKQPVSA